MKMKAEEFFHLFAKDNHFRGRQRITGFYDDGVGIAFDSNVKGCYGENETYHYLNEENALRCVGIMEGTKFQLVDFGRYVEIT